MDRFTFWQRWLFYSSLFIALTAILYAIFPEFSLFKPYNVAINQILWQSKSIPAEAEVFRNFIYGPLGGTMACVYIFLALIAYYPFKKKERWSRNAILFAFSVWFVIDSGICLYYGVFFQAGILNILSMLQKLLPVIFTWKEFKI